MERANAFHDEKSSPASGGESTRTVIVASGANIAVAVAKTVAATLSGSASMVAEAAHSWEPASPEVRAAAAHPELATTH
ncbi:hypothetical protein [Nocardia arthritidis]|uniref:hypothetical protein n=1 Tax=Nocardia arthritidis TaxID=228602 RepID=UPI0007A38100